MCHKNPKKEVIKDTKTWQLHKFVSHLSMCVCRSVLCNSVEPRGL